MTTKLASLRRCRDCHVMSGRWMTLPDGQTYCPRCARRVAGLVNRLVRRVRLGDWNDLPTVFGYCSRCGQLRVFLMSERDDERLCTECAAE